MPRKKKEKEVVHGFGKPDVQINGLFRVIDDGYHNAFTDLCIWNGWYYLAYRKAQWHDPIPPGNVIIARSKDALTWETVATVDTGGDDRDPKFIAHDPSSLTVYFGTYYKRWDGNTLSNSNRDQITCGVQSRNGTAWSTPFQIYRPNYWLWTTQEGYNGYTYGMAYHHGGDFTNSLQLLFKSRQRFGVWETASPALNENVDYSDLSEPALFSLDILNEKFCCIARCADCTLIGTSKFPYNKWSWTEDSVICHSPVVCKVGGKTFVSGRTRLDCIPGLTGEDKEKADHLKKYSNFQYSYEMDTDENEEILAGKPKDWLSDVYRAALFEFTSHHTLKYILTLPSGKDCAYPGMVYDESNKELILSYYSQHDYPSNHRGIPRPADIYIARLGFNDIQS
jgi:hypothetical protein